MERLCAIRKSGQRDELGGFAKFRPVFPPLLRFGGVTYSFITPPFIGLPLFTIFTPTLILNFCLLVGYLPHFIYMMGVVINR